MPDILETAFSYSTFNRTNATASSSTRSANRDRIWVVITPTDVLSGPRGGCSVTKNFWSTMAKTTFTNSGFRLLSSPEIGPNRWSKG